MLFNSPEFLVFLPIVFGLYWFVTHRHLRAQNLLLLVASYVFYGWWDWRFLGLIALSTLVDYFVGIRIEEADDRQRKKRWLWVSLAVNLGILGYFKYANFFIENWITAWDGLGVTMHASTLQIILPVGISFYTFQTLSYSIDIYRGNLKATRDPVAFAAFVSFFPQLVAGPIERATNLLPQITSPRTFTYEQGRDGMRLILWGMFKKVVVADSCAPYVDMCFDNPEAFSGSTLILGAILFSFQIYGDFSGYSDIAIGTAKLFGFELMTNFKFPYFSRDIAEFWRRWHISLSTWFRDYLYIPLGGSRVSKPKAIRNVFIIFLVSGFWHGANWTFIVWGGIHALLFIPLFLRGTNRKNTTSIVAEGKWLPSPRELLQMGWTFSAVTIAWVFFRADNIQQAGQYLLQCMEFSGKNHSLQMTIGALARVSVFTIGDWLLRSNQFFPESRLLRQMVYTAISTAILLSWRQWSSAVHLFPILMTRFLFGLICFLPWFFSGAVAAGLIAQLHPKLEHKLFAKGSQFGHTVFRATDFAGQSESPEILTLGSSTCYRGIDVRPFDATGITAFNLCSSSQSFFNSEYLLHWAIDLDLMPSHVLIDIYPEMWRVERNGVHTRFHRKQ